MGYWKSLLAEAARDTRIIDWSGVLGALVVFAVAYLLTRKFIGKKDAKDGVIQGLVASGATLVVFVLWLGFNLCLLTPKRLSDHKDTIIRNHEIANEDLERTNKLLRAQNRESVANFTAEEIRSTQPGFPYGHEITVQFRQRMEPPVGIRIRTDKPVLAHYKIIGGKPGLNMVQTSDIQTPSSLVEIGVLGPQMSQRTPFVITLFCKEEFTETEMVVLHPR